MADSDVFNEMRRTGSGLIRTTAGKEAVDEAVKTGCLRRVNIYKYIDSENSECGAKTKIA